ncbi:MAG TPA: hypothetical protein VMH27_17570 [Puia sp.]|nr:hypothetical protein [Puia sp.]
MEQEEIKTLLEKYWAAETTLEEECRLAAYFRQPEIAPEWEPIREIFAWREEEAEVVPGPDFNRRMLRRISDMEEAPKISRFSIRFAAAAAIILCLGISLLIPSISPQPRQPVARTAVADTYTDPQQALAAVRKVLLVASSRMNEGKNITQKNMTRLHDTWQTAIRD